MFFWNPPSAEILLFLSSPAHSTAQNTAPAAPASVRGKAGSGKAEFIAGVEIFCRQGRTDSRGAAPAEKVLTTTAAETEGAGAAPIKLKQLAGSFKFIWKKLFKAAQD